MASYRLQDCEYRFYDTPDTYGRALICIGQAPEELKNNPSFDEQVFYYADTEKQFEELFTKESKEDFYLIKEDNGENV